MTAAKTTAKTTTRKPAARKAPQDRKTKAPAKAFPEQIPGWDLLRPFAEIPVWDQAELYAAAVHLSEMHDAGTIDQIKMVGSLAKAMLPFAVDEDEFLAFVSGPQAMLNAAPLVMAWAEQMGKAVNSAA